MSKSKNSSSSYIVIGSSTPLATALNKKVLNSNQSITFFGRSNPFGLEAWQKIDNFYSIEDIQKLSEQITAYIKADLQGIQEVHLVILSGVSTNDWMESLLVNEVMPAIIAEKFVNCLSTDSRFGSVTLISSSGAYRGAKMPYSATKASLTGIMHTLNHKGTSNIRTNIVLPAAFNGGMISDWNNEKRATVAESTLVNRIGSVEEICDAILFTANNGFVADSIINITGGQISIE